MRIVGAIIILILAIIAALPLLLWSGRKLLSYFKQLDESEPEIFDDSHVVDITKPDKDKEDTK